MLNTALTARQNSAIQGACLIATSPIPAGEIIYQLDESKPLVRLYELANWPREERGRFLTYAIQMSKDGWGFGLGNVRLINHSCDPNTWWEEFGTLRARRVIKSGEEVTFDYSTSEISLKYTMDCRCGRKTCRGVVTNKDYLDPDFQEKYKGHLPRHTLDAIMQPPAEKSQPSRAPGHTLPEHVTKAMKEAGLDIETFKEKYGDQYLMEMVKQLVNKNK